MICSPPRARVRTPTCSTSRRMRTIRNEPRSGLCRLCWRTCLKKGRQRRNDEPSAECCFLCGGSRDTFIFPYESDEGAGAGIGSNQTRASQAGGTEGGASQAGCNEGGKGRRRRESVCAAAGCAAAGWNDGIGCERYTLQADAGDVRRG